MLAGARVIFHASFEILLLTSASHNLKVTSHGQQRALQTASDEVYTPRRPSLRPESCREGTSPHETARRLNAHHGYTQRADPLEHKCGVYLREVLDAGEHGRENAQEVGPRLSVFRRCPDEVEGENGGQHGVQNADCYDYQRRAVGGCQLRLRFRRLVGGKAVFIIVECGRVLLAREEDEEE